MQARELLKVGAMRKRREIGERTAGVLGWRVLTVAAFTAVMGRLLVARSGLPGYGAALFALAVPFALGAWAFHVVGSGRASVRRDVLLGVAAGALICAIVGLVW
jgi:hypothetical protein